LPAIISGNGNNSSSFNGLSGGFRAGNEGFIGIGSVGYWWSSSDFNYFNLLGDDGQKDRYEDMTEFLGYFGFSVRCIKD
jgi:hypothetical protein